jgi:hypothetical protein
MPPWSFWNFRIDADNVLHASPARFDTNLVITMSDASNAKLGSINQDILWGCASDESIPSSDEDVVAPGSPSDNFFSTSEDSDRDGDSAAV